MWDRKAKEYVERPTTPCSGCGVSICRQCGGKVGKCPECLSEEKTPEKATGDATTASTRSGEEKSGEGEKSRETGRETPLAEDGEPEEIPVDLDPPFGGLRRIEGTPIDPATVQLPDADEEDPQSDEDDLDLERLKSTTGRLESVSVDPVASGGSFIINPTKTKRGAFSTYPGPRVERNIVELLIGLDKIEKNDLGTNNAIRVLSPWIFNLIDIAIELIVELEGRSTE